MRAFSMPMATEHGFLEERKAALVNTCHRYDGA
jgi:hypothetical protein